MQPLSFLNWLQLPVLHGILKKILWCEPYLKSLLNLLQHCFCFHVLVLWPCGILAPWPGIEPTLPALKGRVLTTELPGKSLPGIFIHPFTFNLFLTLNLNCVSSGQYVVNLVFYFLIQFDISAFWLDCLIHSHLLLIVFIILFVTDIVRCTSAILIFAFSSFFFFFIPPLRFSFALRVTFYFL